MSTHNLKKKSIEMTKIILCLGYNRFVMGVTCDETGKCLLCGKQFSNVPNARRHVKEIHGGQRRSQAQKFECQLCGLEFNRRKIFLEHMTRYHPEF